MSIEKNVLVFFLMALFLLGGQALAKDPGWVKLNGPYGPHIGGLAVDATNPQIIYVAIDGGGVYKSTNGGMTFFEISTGIDDLWEACSIVIHPKNPEILYVGTWYGGIFRTTDGGTTWTRVYNGTDFITVWTIAIDPYNPGTVYIGTEATVWKSTDGGNTWVKKDNGIKWHKIHTLAVDPVDPSTVYAGTLFGDSNYIYKSTNGGDNWITLQTGIDPRAFINSLAVDPKDHLTVYAGTDGGIIKTIDGGMIWISSSVGISNSHINHLVIDPAMSDKIYAATWGGVFMSANGATSWDLTSSSFANPFAKALAVVLSNAAPSGRIIYAGVFGGIYKSVDGGISWEPLPAIGLYRGATIADQCIAVDFNTIYAGTFGGGVFKSTDGGETWRSINTGLATAWGNGGVALSNPGTIYFGTDGGGLYKSTDGGGSWTPKNNGLTKLVISDINVRLDDNETLYLVAGGVFKSVNGGDDWFPMSIGIPNNGKKVKELAISPATSQIMYAASNGDGVFKSTDGGNSWSDISNDLPTLKTWRIATDPYDPQTVYLGTMYDGVFKSIDGGNHWFEINNGLQGYGNLFWVKGFAINPLNPQVLYVGIHGNGIFKSIDGGLTWIPWNDDLANKSINAIVIHPNDTSVVYAGTGEGIFRWGIYFAGIEEDTPPRLPFLSQNFPNPFNTGTSIRYAIPKESFVSLTVYDAVGQKVKTLVNESKQAGSYSVNWNSRDENGNKVATGVYFCRLEAGGQKVSLKMVLVR